MIEKFGGSRGKDEEVRGGKLDKGGREGKEGGKEKKKERTRNGGKRKEEKKMEK